MDKVYLCSCEDIDLCIEEYCETTCKRVDKDNFIHNHCYGCSCSKTVDYEKDIPKGASYLAFYVD